MMISIGKFSSVNLSSYDLPPVTVWRLPPVQSSFFNSEPPMVHLRSKAYLVDPEISFRAFCSAKGCRYLRNRARIFPNNGPMETIFPATNPIWDSTRHQMLGPTLVYVRSWKSIAIVPISRMILVIQTLFLFVSLSRAEDSTSGLEVNTSLQHRRRTWAQLFALESFAVAKSPAWA